jgi:hypothetical protein
MKKIEKVLIELSDGERLTLPPGGSINVHCFHGWNKTTESEDFYLCDFNGSKGFLMYSFPDSLPDSFNEKMNELLDGIQDMLDT